MKCTTFQLCDYFLLLFDKNLKKKKITIFSS